MAQLWFVARGEQVHGPWTTEDVRSHRAGRNISDHDVIWGAGNAAWIAVSQWDPERPVKASAAAAEPPTSVLIARTTAAADEASTAVTSVTSLTRPTHPVWHYAREGKSFGPYERPVLLVELRRLPSLEDVSLWTNGMSAWAPVQEFHDILNEIGANQREHPRAAITGKLVMKYDGLSHVAPLASISEGGVGVVLTSELVTGQKINVDVQSGAFDRTVSAVCEVRYCSNGRVGLKFLGLDAAAKGLFAKYVKQAGARTADAA